MTKAADSRTDHPLDPLSAEEFSAVAALLRRDRGVDPGGGGWRITAIEMVEPDKAELLDFEAGGARPARKALALCLDRRNNATYRSMLSLTDDSVESFEHVPGVQANFTVDEFEECDRVLRSHPDVVAALARRGITDVDLVFMDTWTYGDAVAPPEYRDRRIGWSDTWVRNAPGANPYANPISGLHCVIDLNSMELLRIEDTGPFSEGSGATGADGRVRSQAHSRTDLRVLAARTTQAVGDHPIRGAVLRPGGQPPEMAELESAGGVQPPRGDDVAHRALPGR